ncbi:TolB family protein [Thermoflexus sp.]|uniref:TolB family protein n=1 Tax=Thermoflexus sp. TaxID=1969742 RepID=UPI0035E465C7
MRWLVGWILLVGLVGAGCGGQRLSPEPPTPARPASPTSDPTLGNPMPTPVSSPSPTPGPRLWRLTANGCCVQPFWSPDGQEVWFLDRPDPQAPAGLWGIPATGGTPRLITTRLGIFSPDYRRRAYPEAGQTIIEDLETGVQWVAPSGGRAVAFSPDGEWIAWEEHAAEAPSLDRQVTTLWIARVDGREARPALQLLGGGFAGWLPDGRQVLVITREAPGLDPLLAVVDLQEGSLRPIARGERLRGVQISPKGGWVAYQSLFSADPAQSGLWVVRADGTGSRRLPVFGAYRWRAEGRLLVVPMEPGAPSHRVLEVEAATGAIRSLTDPVTLPFRIAGGDWALSPDGRRIVFVSAEDHNLWVLELP